MRVTRLVPHGSAMMAVSEYLDAAGVRDQEFMDWYAGPMPDDVRRRLPVSLRSHPSIIDILGASAETTRDLAVSGPDTETAQAWAQALYRAVAATEADVDRVWDLVDFATPAEFAAIDDLDALAQELRDISPMLGEVADFCSTITDMWTLGDVVAQRRRFGEHGFWPGTNGDTGAPVIGCEQAMSGCRDCLGDAEFLAHRHIEMLAPGTVAKVVALFAELTAGMPSVVADGDLDVRRGTPTNTDASTDTNTGTSMGTSPSISTSISAEATA